MRFLRSIAGYRRVNERKSINIIEELNIFSLGEKVKEYHQNCLEHILRIVNLQNFLEVV
jgi:hypothetical protein